MRSLPAALVLFFLPSLCIAEVESSPVKVGVATILSGDLSVIGDNIQKTATAYQQLFPSPRLRLIFEDTRLTSTEGLRAYQKLIQMDEAKVVIGACTSNGTLAAVSLFNLNKIPAISVATGGRNVDNAGDFVFRIGNSDSLNGTQQAEYFIEHGMKKVAVLTEQTEYTQDITRFFVPRFEELGGTLLFNEEFLPGTSDFRSIIVKFRKDNPQAIFVPTQTGTALGIFLKQWHELASESKAEIHTTFVAGPNHDAHQVAGPLIVGVYYMEPVFSETNERRKQLFEKYFSLFGVEPSIPFHSAGFADTLDLLSKYLETHPKFDQQSFREYLLSVRDYDGMLGKLSFDDKGNTAIGFRIKRIDKNLLDTSVKK